MASRRPRWPESWTWHRCTSSVRSGQWTEVQRLNGLGPFYASLVVLRPSGFADATLQAPEPKVFGHVARLYELDGPPSLEQFNEIAEPWRPFRTWATVLIRLAGDRASRR
jgi:DNA-3-methyladenine glycosylase II